MTATPATAVGDPSGPACASCEHLEDARGRRPSCTLRDVAVAEPAASWCASHPSLGPLRHPVPIGPVLRGDPAHDPAAGHVLHPAPDSPHVRRRLLDLIERIEVRGREPLSLREHAVVEHLRQCREGLAWQHIDRIEASLAINTRQRPPTVIHSALQTDLTEYTPIARLVLFSGVMVWAGLFALLLWIEAEIASSLASSVVLHWGLAAGIAATVAALWLRVVFGLLRQRGIAIRTNAEADATVAEDDPTAS